MYLFAELVRLMDEVTPEHRIVVTSDRTLEAEGEHERFDLPSPLSGRLFIIPYESQLINRLMPKGQPPRAGEVDSQLKRLVAQGWAVTRDEGAYLVLTKGEGETYREIKHFKPGGDPARAKKKK